MRILVTGASGFAGRYLVEELAKKHTVVGIDRHDNNSKNITKSYKLDLIDFDNLFKVLSNEKPDVIFHLASQTKGWFGDMHRLIASNVTSTINLYETILKIRSKTTYNPKILYVGSSEAYGRTPSPAKISENTPLRPVNQYAATKAAMDDISFSYSNNQMLNIIIARPFTHTGPGQSEGFFVPDMASQIAKIEKSKKPQKLYVGDLEAIRDYLDVRDVVRAYVALLDADITPGEALNICSGKGVKVEDILNKLISFSKVQIQIEKDPKRLRPSDTPVFVGDNTKMTKYSDWKPRIDLDTTLKDTLNYWREK